MGTARRTHNKSRNGCRQCKERRVKCDEKTPCGACTKRQATCSLSFSPSPVTHVVRTEVGDSFCSADFALFNHWMSSTWLVVSNEPIELSPWRQRIPLLAPHHPYLLHQILAVSAIHLSQLASGEAESMEYAKVAREHEAQALGLARIAILEASPDNAAPLFATSALIVSYYFAAAKDPAMLLFSEDPPGPPEWMLPIRGANVILRSQYDSLFNGPLSELMQQYHTRELTLEEVAKSPSDRRLVEMRDRLSPSDQKLLHADIEELRVCFALSDQGDPLSCKAAALRAPSRMSDEFMRMLGRKEQAALVLWVFWLALLARVTKGVMMGDCSPLDMVEVLVSHCTEETLSIIEWPVQQVRAGHGSSTREGSKDKSVTPI